jgi:hypothetical protein
VTTNFAVLERAQLRLDLGGGVADGHATGIGKITGLWPLGNYAAIGARLGFEPREAPLAVDAVAMLRAPIFARAGALELGVTGGWTPWGASGFDAGVVTGVWFAMAPTWSIQLDAEFSSHGLLASGGTFTPIVTATVGVARLFRR